MNQTQIVTALGPVLGMLAGYLAAWWGVDQATMLGVLTALCGVVPSLYNLYLTRKSNQVSQVANMPEVRNIVLDKAEPATKALEAATPNNVSSQ